MQMSDRSCAGGPRRRRCRGWCPPTAHEVVWRRPPPGPVTSLSYGGSVFPATGNERAPVAVGLSLGQGQSGSRSAATTSSRTKRCGRVSGARTSWSRVRGSTSGVGTEGQPMVFDEFHHGRGVHEGSVTAIWSYLSQTASGRFFATLLVAGVAPPLRRRAAPDCPARAGADCPALAARTCRCARPCVFRRGRDSHGDRPSRERLASAYGPDGCCRPQGGRSRVSRRSSRGAFRQWRSRRRHCSADCASKLRRASSRVVADAIDEIERVVAAPPPPAKA